MTLNKELQTKNKTSRVHVKSKKGGRDKSFCKGSVKNEANNLAWYVKGSKEEIVGSAKMIEPSMRT